MKLTALFFELNKGDSLIAGGKGASLGEMTQAGIPVPSGFVVLTDCFEQFLNETDLSQEVNAIIGKVNHNEVHTIENASESIQELIYSREMPKDIESKIIAQFKLLSTKYVAVRSSATAEDGGDHAWAGQLDSYLNTTKDNLIDNIKRCWASLFTPRAIFYRFEKGLHNTKISVAVIIQKMIESESSGIAFSIHPVTEDANQLIIEAGYGLGEAIVSGLITPDSYVVTKDPRDIIDININTQTKGLYRASRGGNEWVDIPEPKASAQVLNKYQILELSSIILKIEEHYGFPCDIEWGYEVGKFYILQSRPITTLAIKSQHKESSAKIEYAKYQQLFSTNGMSFLMSDIFFQFYKKLDALIVFAHDKWTSFLPNTIIEKTLKDGLKLLSDKESFLQYKKGIHTYFEEAFKLFEKIFSFEILTETQCKQILEKMSEFYVYYSKTEFFYVDEAYRLSEENDTIRENIKEFEEIKNESRLKMNKMFFQPDSYRRQLMAKIGTQFNLTKDEVSSYGTSDLPLLFNGIRLSNEVIKNRENSYLMKSENNKIEYNQGQLSERVIDSFFSQINTGVGNQLKGITTNKGNVKASATVIKYGNDMFSRLPEIIRNMPVGNVLVSDTTSPELLMACKKASAIITNQGGMMSHAAIVSRELNIPCIVGLRIATDRIKDGDIIEVDADNGIVIIHKHE